MTEADPDVSAGQHRRASGIGAGDVLEGLDGPIFLNSGRVNGTNADVLEKGGDVTYSSYTSVKTPAWTGATRSIPGWSTPDRTRYLLLGHGRGPAHLDPRIVRIGPDRPRQIALDRSNS